MNLAVTGLILMFVPMFVLIKDKLSPPVVFIPLPLIATVAGGFGIEAISGFVKTGFNTMLSTVVLSIFFISYFTLMSNGGLLDPITHFLIKQVGNNVTIMPLTVVITTFMAHLGGSGVTTFLIVAPVFLSIYKRLKVRPEALFGTMCGTYGVTNIVPWGGSTIRTAFVIGIEISDLYQFTMPSVVALAVIALGIVFVIARIEIHNGTGADKGDVVADEKGAGGGTTKRKKLYWFNLGLTVLMLVPLLVDIGLPLHLTFMIALCIALIVNYPNMVEQAKQLKSYVVSAMIMTMALFSVGTFMGVIKDSGMVEAMAAVVVGILPAGVAPRMHWSMTLFTVPPITILGTDASYYALMPIILGMVEQFGISPEVVTATFLLTAVLGTPISPSVVVVYMGFGLAGSTIDKHIKYFLRTLWSASTLLLVVPTLIGIIRSQPYKRHTLQYMLRHGLKQSLQYTTGPGFSPGGFGRSIYMVFQAIALLSLTTAIVLGFVKKINVGIASLGPALVLGMIGGVDTKMIFDGFPSKLFIALPGTMFFFCLPQENHMPEPLSGKMVTLVGTYAYLIPITIHTVPHGLSATGPGAISVQSVMIIFVVPLAVQMDTSPVLMACMAILGVVGGIALPVALSGIIVTDLTAEFGFPGMAAPVFVGVTAANLLCAVLLCVAYKGYKLKLDHIVSASDLSAFNRQQKMGITAILVLVIAVIGFQYDVELAPFALALVLIPIGAVNEKAVAWLVPQSMLILICGVDVLMSVTKEMSGIELPSNLLAFMMNQVTTAPLIGLTTGIMSWFSSANSVVLPILIPTVPNIVSNVGGSTSALEMVMSIVGGATVTGISLLSTGGSLSLASYTQETDASEKVQQSLFARLFVLSFPAVMVIVIFVLAGGSKLFC